MTAEVAVMNKSAVAIASDSAVTTESINSSGEWQDKIFNTANKVFALSKFAPVGIMVYNTMELGGVPWETLIKEYRKYLKQRKFDCLEQYADDLFQFFTGRDRPFGDKHLHKVLFISLARYFRSLMISHGIRSNRRAREVFDEQIERLKKIEFSESFQESFSQLPHDCRVAIEEAVNEVFRPSIIRNLKTKYRELATLAITKNEQSFGDSGVVVTGFGEKELFPTLIEYKTDLVIPGKVRKAKVGAYTPDHFTSGKVLSFAQSDITRTILEGINPSFAAEILRSASQVLHKLPENIIDGIAELGPDEKSSYKKRAKKASRASMDNFLEDMVDECKNNHISQIENAIKMMPFSELAEVAELLIKLTQVRRRLSPDSETVGGPIDVAVISKADGFIWIKRKFYFDKELNYAFFDSYLT